MTWSIGTIYIYYLAKFLTPSLKNEILTSEAEVEVEADAEVKTESRYR